LYCNLGEILSNEKWSKVVCKPCRNNSKNVLGLIIAFIILRFYGLSTHESVQLQAIFFVASYARSYAVRRAFNQFENKRASQ
jgi:hypothetical protein